MRKNKEERKKEGKENKPRKTSGKQKIKLVLNANILVISVHINWQNGPVNRSRLSDWTKWQNLYVYYLQKNIKRDIENLKIERM